MRHNWFGEMRNVHIYHLKRIPGNFYEQISNILFWFDIWVSLIFVCHSRSLESLCAWRTSLDYAEEYVIWIQKMTLLILCIIVLYVNCKRIAFLYFMSSILTLKSNYNVHGEKEGVYPSGGCVYAFNGHFSKREVQKQKWFASL